MFRPMRTLALGVTVPAREFSSSIQNRKQDYIPSVLAPATLLDQCRRVTTPRTLEQSYQARAQLHTPVQFAGSAAAP